MEARSFLIQDHKYYSVQNDFDRVSDQEDKGPTPLQGQQDEQLPAVNVVDMTIGPNVIYIHTSYVKWSTNTYDIIDTNDIDDIDRQDIQRQIRNDTPVETNDNKLYIDNISSYDRDMAMMSRSLSDRLGLGCTSLLGAQQVIPTGKPNDQGIYIPNYLRQIMIGENARNIHSEIQDKRDYIIPQGDGIVDSNTSSSMTTDGIDLTVSPLKRKTRVTDKHKKNIDASDEGIQSDNQRKTRSSIKHTGIGETSARANLNKAQTQKLNDSKEKSQAQTDKSAKANDNQINPNASKSRVVKAYQIDYEDRIIKTKMRKDKTKY